MRATLVLVAMLSIVGCSAPSDASEHGAGRDAPAPGSHGPIVGHVRLRDRTIDLTVDALDARGGDVDLRRATARHEPEVWADTDQRELRRAD